MWLELCCSHRLGISWLLPSRLDNFDLKVVSLHNLHMMIRMLKMICSSQVVLPNFSVLNYKPRKAKSKYSPTYLRFSSINLEGRQKCTSDLPILGDIFV